MDAPFADLWAHGLAVVGFHGFGPLPLYEQSYAAQVAGAEAARTPLQDAKGELLGAFMNDESFEVLHFVPLYFHDAPRTMVLEALSEVAATPEGVPDVHEPLVRDGALAIASVLTGPWQRRILGRFVAALEAEMRTIDAIRADGATSRQARLSALTSTWNSRYVPELMEFLSHEGFLSGVAIVTPALGAEGRFMPHAKQGAMVALGLSDGDPPEAALSALVRELCYPVVRRALDPFEGRFSDRKVASQASDLAATRCGEVLLASNAPDLLPAYRSRFQVRWATSESAFLSTAGLPPGVAALEETLDRALRRELHLNEDTTHAGRLVVGR